MPSDPSRGCDGEKAERVCVNVNVTGYGGVAALVVVTIARRNDSLRSQIGTYYRTKSYHRTVSTCEV